jgi:hypothetical protein
MDANGMGAAAGGAAAAAAAAAADDAEEEAEAGEFDTFGGSKTSRWHPGTGNGGPGSGFAAAAAGAAGAAAGAAAQRIPQAAAARSDMGLNGDARVDLSAYHTLSPRSLSKASAQGGPWIQQPGKGGCASWLKSLRSCFGSCTAGPESSHKPLPTGTAFWEEFSGSIHLLCLSEIKYAMMAQSVVGVPGVMTLLCNLSTTVDFGLELMQETSNLPPWMRDYMVGASQELYKLRTFPTTLVGRTVKEAAGFIFDSCHAVLLAVEPTTGLQRHRMIVGDLQQVCGCLCVDLVCGQKVQRLCVWLDVPAHSLNFQMHAAHLQAHVHVCTCLHVQVFVSIMYEQHMQRARHSVVKHRPRWQESTLQQAAQVCCWFR